MAPVIIRNLLSYYLARGGYEAYTNLGINSGSPTEALYKKLAVFPFFKKGLEGFSHSTTAPKTFFYLNPKQLIKTERSDIDEKLWRPEKNPDLNNDFIYGVNFQKLEKAGRAAAMKKVGNKMTIMEGEGRSSYFDDYLTTSLYKLYQLDTEVNGFVNGLKEKGKIPFQIRKILTTNSEKVKMINLMKDINRILEKNPGFIHHLAQFKAYSDYLRPQECKVYAEYILYSLISSFNPIKLKLQKAIFSPEGLKGRDENVGLLTEIEEFNKNIKNIAGIE